MVVTTIIIIVSDVIGHADVVVEFVVIPARSSPNHMISPSLFAKQP